MCSTKSISLRKFALRSSCFRREDASVSAFNRSNARGITPSEKRREVFSPNFRERKVRNSQRFQHVAHQRRRITTQSRKKNEKKSRVNHAPTRTREQRNRTSAAEPFFERAIFYGVCDLYTKLKAWSVAHARTGEEEVSFFLSLKGKE